MESDTKERKMGTIESRKSIKGAWKIVSLGAMYVCHPFSLTIPLIYTNYAAALIGDTQTWQLYKILAYFR